MNAVIWGVQIFLALFFLGAAYPKLTGRGLERWTGFSKLPRALVLGIGIAEVLGSVGLVLPMATGILRWLTPLAAIGLAINVLMAAGFQVREDERLKAILTTLWATIAGIIAIGRWNLIDQAALAISPRALAAALAVLLPAAITIVIIVFTPPAPPPPPRPRPGRADRGSRSVDWPTAPARRFGQPHHGAAGRSWPRLMSVSSRTSTEPGSHSLCWASR